MRISYTVEIIIVVMLIVIGVVWYRLMWQAAPTTSSPPSQVQPVDTATSASPRLPPPGAPTQ